MLLPASSDPKLHALSESDRLLHPLHSAFCSFPFVLHAVLLLPYSSLQLHPPQFSPLFSPCCSADLSPDRTWLVMLACQPSSTVSLLLFSRIGGGYPVKNIALLIL